MGGKKRRRRERRWQNGHQSNGDGGNGREGDFPFFFFPLIHSALPKKGKQEQLDIGTISRTDNCDKKNSVQILFLESILLVVSTVLKDSMNSLFPFIDPRKTFLEGKKGRRRGWREEGTKNLWKMKGRGRGGEGGLLGAAASAWKGRLVDGVFSSLSPNGIWCHTAVGFSYPVLQWLLLLHFQSLPPPPKIRRRYTAWKINNRFTLPQKVFPGARKARGFWEKRGESTMCSKNAVSLFWNQFPVRETCKPKPFLPFAFHRMDEESEPFFLVTETEAPVFTLTQHGLYAQGKHWHRKEGRLGEHYDHFWVRKKRFRTNPEHARSSQQIDSYLEKGVADRNIIEH